MISQLQGLPRLVFGCVASGQINSQDYDDVISDIHASISEGYDIACLIEYRSDASFAPHMEETIFENLKELHGRTRRFALVGAKQWRDHYSHVSNFLVDCESRMFLQGKRNEALDWLLAAPFLRPVVASRDLSAHD